VIIVPALGYSFGGFQTSGGTIYASLGPIPVGVWIDWIDFSFEAQAVGTVLLGLALGPGGDSTLESFQAGATLIDSSRIRADGKPVLEFLNAVDSIHRLAIAIGRRVVGVQQFVTVAFRETTGTASATGNVSIHTRRLVEGGDISKPRGQGIEPE